MQIYFFKGLKSQFKAKAKTCIYFGKYRALIVLFGYGIGIDYTSLVNLFKSRTLTKHERVRAYKHAYHMIAEGEAIGVCSALHHWLQINKRHWWGLEDISELFPEFYAQRPADYTPNTTWWWSILDTESRLTALDNAIQITNVYG